MGRQIPKDLETLLAIINRSSDALRSRLLSGTGQIVTHNGTEPVGLSPGVDSYHLAADSSSPSGLVWADPAISGGGIVIENTWSATTTDTTVTPLAIISGPVLAIPEPGALNVWGQLIAKRIGTNDYHTKSFAAGYTMQSGVAVVAFHGVSQGGSGLSIVLASPISVPDGVISFTVQSLVTMNVEYRAYTKAIVLLGS